MTKFPLLAGFWMLAALTPLFAEPEPAPNVPKSGQPAEAALPRAQVENFFTRLTEGRVDVAYDQLIKGTKIANNPKDVVLLKAKTREAIKVFGAVNGFDWIDAKNVGNYLTRVTCISRQQYPVRWRFYFYLSPDGAWKLIDIRIDDRLLDMFEEPAPAPAPAK